MIAPPESREAHRPLVSVVIPAYNPVATFLCEAVESVVQQSFDRWELLLVDDGSDDPSRRLFAELASGDPRRIRSLSHPGHVNRGISATRNLGIREASGDLIAFLDADDVWRLNKLEDQVRVMADNPEAGMVYGGSLYWSSWTGDSHDRDRDFIPSLGVPPDTLIQPPALVPLHVRGKAALPCPSSIMVRRETALSVGGFEPSFPGMYEDQVFCAKICLATPVFVSGTCWDHYRIHPGQMCAGVRSTGEVYLSRLRFFDWLLAYLATRGCGEPGAWEAASRERWLIRHYRDVDPSLPAGRARHLVRWFKKWVLRAEERLLAGKVGRRVWAHHLR